MDTREVTVSGTGLRLHGILGVPEDSIGLVIFAHGSGSGRFSPRNNFVAGVLQEHKVATLLLDLLSEEEEDDRAKVFDIGLLAERLDLARRWVQSQRDIASLPVGYFGASTGGGAAIAAAAMEPVFAVVSRGGRPDLAGASLEKVKSPTLLIVGGDDPAVIALNREAFGALRCEKKLEIIPGATHLFEEPGALAKVAELAAAWFEKHALQGTARQIA